MNRIQRTRGIRKLFRTRVMNIPAQRYITAGSESCGRMMRAARRRPVSGPSDSAILAWARFDLAREILDGYWRKAA